MDSNTTITGGIFVLLCIILFVLINRNKSKKVKQFLQPLNRLAEKYNCKISQYDIWNNSIIGLDNLANQIFVIKNISNEDIHLNVKLMEIQKCRVNEVSRTVNIASRTMGIKGNVVKDIDKIELVFINNDKNAPDLIAEFYNKETGNLNLTGELQMAEKWCKIANDKITTFRKK
jgi:hypothetical protein